MSLQAAIKSKLGVDATIRTGGIGALEVLVNGATVFSKKGEGRVPPADELLSRIQAAGGVA